MQVYQVPDGLNPEFPIDGTGFYNGASVGGGISETVLH